MFFIFTVVSFFSLVPRLTPAFSSVSPQMFLIRNREYGGSGSSSSSSGGGLIVGGTKRKQWTYDAEGSVNFIKIVVLVSWEG